MFSREPEPRGTAGALRYARDWVQDTVLVVNGDTIVTVDYHALVTWHRLWRSVLTVAAQERSGGNGQVLLTHQPVGFGFPLQSGRIVRVINEDPRDNDVYGHPLLVNAGVYVLDPNVLQVIPDGEICSLDRDVLPMLIDRGVPCWAYADDVTFFDIGTPERYQEAQTRFQEPRL